MLAIPGQEISMETVSNTILEVTSACGFKGTHTVYFSSLLYIINQKPMIPRTPFHCKTT